MTKKSPTYYNYNNAEITVSLSAIEKNLNTIKGKLTKNQEIMAVVKSNAYGHGAVEVAQFLEDHVSWFAVNSVDEGVRLRQAGIENGVLVFCVPELQSSGVYKDYLLTATVSGREHFRFLVKGTDYHLNFDTGMGRLGFRPEEVPSVLESVQKYDHLNCTGIYTHFATAYEPDSERVKNQLMTFRNIRNQFDGDLLTHASNTGGIFFYPDTLFDMVRPGIGLYGYPPGRTEIGGLTPALSLRSKIVQVKTLEKGDCVSYGAHWEAPEKTNIGIIPAGYEDGISRNLSGRLHVKIGEKLYPVVGTITMNYCMADLGSDKYDQNTPVEFLNQDKLTAQHWAEKLNTIPYEILSDLPAHITRVYHY